MILLFITLFIILGYVCKLFLDKVYENETYIVRIGNFCYYNLGFYLFLLIIYLSINFDNFIFKSTSHVLNIPVFLLIIIFLFKEDLKKFLPKIFKIRILFFLPYLSISALNYFFLNLDLYKYFIITDITEPKFDHALLNMLTYSFIFFSELPLLVQILLLFPFSVGINKILSLPEIQNFIALLVEENTEYEQLGYHALMKELIVSSKPVRNTVEALTQKSLILTGEDVVGNSFKKTFLEECHKLKILSKEGEGFRLEEKKESFKEIFSLSNCKRIKGINIDHPYIKGFSMEEIQKHRLKFETLKKTIDPKELSTSIRQVSQIRINPDKNIHLERANISERGRPVTYKVQGFLNTYTNEKFNKEDVDKVYKDNAIGPGEVDTDGIAGAINLAFSALDGVEVLNKTFFVDAKIVGGGTIYRGDVVIYHQGVLMHMEIKDYKVDSIPNQKVFQRSITDNIKGSKAEFIMLKIPYIYCETDTKKVVSSVQDIIKDETYKEKTFFVITSEQVIKINETTIHEEELPT